MLVIEACPGTLVCTSFCPFWQQSKTKMVSKYVSYHAQLCPLIDRSCNRNVLPKGHFTIQGHFDELNSSMPGLESHKILPFQQDFQTYFNGFLCIVVLHVSAMLCMQKSMSVVTTLIFSWTHIHIKYGCCKMTNMATNG